MIFRAFKERLLSIRLFITQGKTDKLILNLAESTCYYLISMSLHEFSLVVER
jgi:hypothetical protein